MIRNTFDNVVSNALIFSIALDLRQFRKNRGGAVSVVIEANGRWKHIDTFFYPPTSMRLLGDIKHHY